MNHLFITWKSVIYTRSRFCLECMCARGWKHACGSGACWSWLWVRTGYSHKTHHQFHIYIYIMLKERSRVVGRAGQWSARWRWSEDPRKKRRRWTGFIHINRVSSLNIFIALLSVAEHEMRIQALFNKLCDSTDSTGGYLIRMATCVLFIYTVFQ